MTNISLHSYLPTYFAQWLSHPKQPPPHITDNLILVPPPVLFHSQPLPTINSGNLHLQVRRYYSLLILHKHGNYMYIYVGHLSLTDNNHTYCATFLYFLFSLASNSWKYNNSAKVFFSNYIIVHDTNRLFL